MLYETRFSIGSIINFHSSPKGVAVYYKPSLGAILVGVIPFAALCFSVPLWDRIHPFVLGLPFNIFWIITWIVLTPICLFAAHRIETARLAPKNGASEKERDPK